MKIFYTTDERSLVYPCSDWSEDIIPDPDWKVGEIDGSAYNENSIPLWKEVNGVLVPRTAEEVAIDMGIIIVPEPNPGEVVHDGYLPLDGYLTIPEEIFPVLSGHLSIPDKIGSIYRGSYNITPDDNFQLLPTASTFLEDDILIHPIPYAEVSNEKGGYTVTIGG